MLFSVTSIKNSTFRCLQRVQFTVSFQYQQVLSVFHMHICKYRFTITDLMHKEHKSYDTIRRIIRTKLHEECNDEMPCSDAKPFDTTMSQMPYATVPIARGSTGSTSTASSGASPTSSDCINNTVSNRGS